MNKIILYYHPFIDILEFINVDLRESKFMYRLPCVPRLFVLNYIYEYNTH